MSDDPSAAHRSWLQRLTHFISGEPEDREDLLELLRVAQKRKLIAHEALSMIEGVLQVSELRVRDISIPRAQMVVVSQEAEIGAILPLVAESAHSRYPVIGEDRTEVVGILLVKDLLLSSLSDQATRVRDIMRPPLFVPESKRLNVLLLEFRATRSHMAIVVDEYGAAAGLVTIEDVLEQIVGEIEDEFDSADDEGDIFALPDGSYRLNGDTSVERVNEAFGLQLAVGDFDTIGGLIAHEMGHVPRRGETYSLGGVQFTVQLARGGAVRRFRVSRPA